MKRNMTKKWIGLLLVIGMLLGMIPLSVTTSAVTVNNVTLPLSNYPSGSYFTKNGKACTTHDGCELINNYTDTNCNCKFAFGAMQCQGFALYTYGEIWKTENPKNSKYKKSIGVSLTSSATDAATILKAHVTAAGVGSHLRVYDGKGREHSMIIASIDGDNVTIYHGNADNHCIVEYKSTTFTQLGDKYKGYKIMYIFINRNITYEEPIIEPPSVTINGPSTNTLYLSSGYNTISLSATTNNLPNGTLAWSTSNSSVATVNGDGLVTANGYGTATITAKYTVGSQSDSASCTVTVSRDSVSVSPSATTIYVGQTVNLSASTNPSGGAISWSSNNTGVATVSTGGQVTARSNGTATITASSSGGGSGTCTVTVSRDSVSVSPSATTIYVGQTVNLSASTNPSGGAISWSSNNTGVATVSTGGQVTARSNGTATITASSNRGGSGTCTVTVNNRSISVSPSTVALTPGSNANLTANISPAPASSDTVTYSWSSSNTSVATVSGSGKTATVSAGNAHHGTGTVKVTVNVNGIAAGSADCAVSLMPSDATQAGKFGTSLNYAYNASTQKLVVSGSGAMDNSPGISDTVGSNLSLSTLKSQVKTIVIENGITTIGNAAFSNFTVVTDVTLPDTITSIGNWAFYDCYQLKNFNWPEELVSIGDHAFSGCNAIFGIQGSLELPNRLKTIGEAAFSGCSNLTELSLPLSVETIGFGAFRNINCQTLYIPKYVKSVGAQAFDNGKNSTNISDVYVAGEDTTFGDNAFGTDAPGLYMYGLVGSEAETYAEKNKITFIPINGVLPNGEIGWEWNPYNHVLVINGSGPMPDWSSTGSVPWNVFNTENLINEVFFMGDITSIGNRAFYNSDKLKRVFLPDTITSIGDWAFRDCDVLTDVDLPDTVTSIGNYAFYKCGKLESWNWPANLVSIGDSAFADCGAFYGERASLTLPDKLKTIGKSAFSGCYALTSITLPDSLETIGENAFLHANCAELVIPENVKSIGKGAFVAGSSSTNVSDVMIAGRNTVIAAGAFGTSSTNTMNMYGYTGSTADSYAAGYDYITFVPMNGTIPGSNIQWEYKHHTGVLTLTGTGAMPNWASKSDIPWNQIYPCEIKEVVIGNGVTSVGDRSFYNNAHLTKVTLPATITYIGNWAFRDCAALTSINLPNTVTSIGAYAFYKCGQLKSWHWPTNLVSIGDSAFADCGAFYGERTSLTLPDKLKTIGIGAFSGCYALTSITFPDSLETIGNYAFRHANCATLVIPENVQSIGYNAFVAGNSSTNVSDVMISNRNTVIDSDAFGTRGSRAMSVYGYTGSTAESYAAGYTNITFVPMNATLQNGNIQWVYTPHTGLLEITGTGEMPDWSAKSDIPWNQIYPCNIKEVVIGDGITSVGGRAFYDCDQLTKVTLPATITSIGSWTFRDCTALTDINLPDSITSIKARAFNGCGQLESWHWPANLESIGESAFANCGAFYGELVTLTLPEKLRNIENSAFSGCYALTGITFPESLQFIGNNAFEHANCAEIIIPKNVMYVSEGAFVAGDSSTNVHSITVEGRSTMIDDGAFGTKSTHLIYVYGPAGCNAESFAATYENMVFVPVSGTLQNGKIQWNWDRHTGVMQITGTGAMPDWDASADVPWCDLNQGNIKEVVIGSGITSVGSRSFYKSTQLTKVTLPDTITSVGSYAFSECAALAEINLPDTITAVADRAFFNCGKLKNLILPANLVSIGDYAFSQCAAFYGHQRSLILPEKLKTIGKDAFSSCYGLVNITFPASLETIGDNAFKDANCATLLIPENVRSIGKGAFEAGSSSTNARNVIITGRNTTIASGAFGAKAIHTMRVYGYAGSPAESFVAGYSNVQFISITDTISNTLQTIIQADWNRYYKEELAANPYLRTYAERTLIYANNGQELAPEDRYYAYKIHTSLGNSASFTPESLASLLEDSYYSVMGERIHITVVSGYEKAHEAYKLEGDGGSVENVYKLRIERGIGTSEVETEIVVHKDLSLSK